VKGFFEDGIGEVLAGGFIGLFLFLVVKGVVEEALDVGFVEFLQKDLRVPVIDCE
jgi:hypothetical protein